MCPDLEGCILIQGQNTAVRRAGRIVIQIDRGRFIVGYTSVNQPLKVVAAAVQDSGIQIFIVDVNNLIAQLRIQGE
jgi:hypothetical protein